MKKVVQYTYSLIEKERKKNYDSYLTTPLTTPPKKKTGPFTPPHNFLIGCMQKLAATIFGLD
jgi:hypothetical protein